MKQQYIVSDTNIFIDLIIVGLLHALFELPWEIHTTDFVIVEVKDVKQKKEIEKHISNRSLLVKHSTPDEVEELIQYWQQSNLSITDCSVWKLAEELGCALLTGDNKLRKMVSNTLEVHGVLYVFNQLVENRIVSTKIATQKLQYLLKINNRLPQEDAEALIKKWSKTK